MTAKSHSRGHEIEWVEDDSCEEGAKWVYSDTKEDLPATGGKERACKKCGAEMHFHEVDGCLGVLPGVVSSCCGHGVREDSYVTFENGVILKGFYLERNKTREIDNADEAMLTKNDEPWRDETCQKCAWITVPGRSCRKTGLRTELHSEACPAFVLSNNEKQWREIE